LVEKSGGKRQLARFGCTWEDNIKLGLKHDGIAWTKLIWHKDKRRAVVNMAMNIRV
jgi:hypothetical protein